MNIAVVANPGSPHVIRWVDAYEQRGHTVAIFAPAGLAYECDRAVVEFGRVSDSGVLATIRRARDLGRQVRDFGADVVHAHFVLNFGTWAVLSRVRPVVVSAWGSDLFIAPKASPSNSLKVRFALRWADAVTFNSADLGRVARDLGAPASRLHRIVFGVDTTMFEPREPNDVDAPVKFLSTRQLKPLYHIDDIVRAFAQADLSDAAELIVSSFGPQEDELRGLAATLGVEDRIRFTGRVSDQEMIDLYRESDVYVTVPESDSIAVSLLEAMSCGLAAIASDLPPNREWLGSAQEGGVIVGVGDVNGLADAMRQVTSDRSAFARMGKRNRDVVVHDADWTGEVTKMEQLFERLIDRDGK